MKGMKQIGIILTLCLLLTACSKEDDISEIFEGNRFKITGLTYNGQKVVKEVKEFYAGDNVYWISFSQLAFSGVLEAGVQIEGSWSANGKNRELTMRVSSPKNVDNTSDLCGKVYNIIKNATEYSGDKNVLKIKKDNNTFIELNSMY